MDDVVASSGRSKGTVYWHYKSKDGLLAAIMRRLLNAELRKLNRLTDSTSVEQALLAYVQQFAGVLQRLSALMPLALDFYAMARRKDWVRQFLQEYYAEYRAGLSAIVQAGIARGEFRAVSVDDTAVALMALMEGMILMWTVDRDAVRVGYHLEVAFGLVLEGLRVRPPAADGGR